MLIFSLVVNLMIFLYYEVVDTTLTEDTATDEEIITEAYSTYLRSRSSTSTRTTR